MQARFALARRIDGLFSLETVDGELALDDFADNIAPRCRDLPGQGLRVR
jgi:hypothetical protein